MPKFKTKDVTPQPRNRYNNDVKTPNVGKV